MASDQVIVRFVKNSENVKVLELMEKAFLAVQEVCATSVWFSEDDCLTLSKYEKYVFFVFGSFSGNGFEKVTLLGNRVYGAPCILHCLETGEPLPKLQHPVYSLSMKGIVVTCTNLSAVSRKEIHEKVEWMMGEAIKDMNVKVNCLIAGEVGSKKYLMAGVRRNKIMLPEWVQNVWNDSRHELIHCSDTKYNEYKCPIFKGFSICATGLHTQERAQIKNVVEKEGGRFSGEMKVNECTHLIVREPSGQKYEFAKKWNIFTIRSEWIYESLEAGYCLEESKYALSDTRSSKITSTPNKIGQECDISSICNLSSISVTHINETENMSSSQAFSIRNLASQKPADILSALNDLDLKRPRSDSYLNGCQIYVYGPSLESSDKIRNLINNGYGTRFNQLNENVSHVVAETVNDALVQQLSKLNKRPHVVSLMWLVESFKSGRCLPEEPFLLIQNQPKNQPMTPLVKSSKPNVARSLAENLEADHASNMEIASLYSQNAATAQTKCSEFGDQTMMAAVKMMEESKSSTWNRETVEVEQDVMDFDGEGDKTIFNGLTFNIFHREFMEELTKDIEAYGGKVLPLNSRKVARIGVVPIEGCSVTKTVDEVVTTAWVNMCIEESKLLPFNSIEIFRPITILPNCQPLKECVLSISGVQGLEKNIIMDIIQLLGGRVQDCFVRVRKENFLACTHLVANVAEGQKYDAATKWGIPVVSKSWVYECARTGRKAPEKNFCPQKMLESGLDNDGERAAKSSSIGAVKETFAPKNQTSLKPNTPIGAKPANERSAKTTIPVVAEVHPQKETVVHPQKETVVLPQKEIKVLPQVEAPVTPLTSRVPTKTPLMRSENKVPVQHPVSTKVTRVQALIGSTRTPDNITPSKFMSGKPYRPQFNFQSSLDDMQSPMVTTKPSTRTSLPLEEVFAENINIAVRNSANGAGRDDSFSQRQNFEKQTEDLQLPLSGVVMSVSRKLIKNQTEYNRLATELGAEYCWKDEANCTHFIFQGKANDVNKEFRDAREQGRIIVSPHWLKACYDQMERVDEGLFPHTYDGNASPGEKPPSVESPKNLPEAPSDTPQQSPLPQNVSDDPILTPEEEQPENPTTLNFLKGLKQLTEVSRSSLRGKPKAVTESKEAPQKKGAKSLAGKPEDISKHPSLKRSAPKSSQCEVSWGCKFKTDDSEVDASERKRSRTSQKSEVDPDDEQTPDSSGPKDKKISAFMLTGFPPEERKECVSVIESLGSCVVDGLSSHLISYCALRSEKFLACVSTGKWILHKSYLTACKEAGHFVKEEDYEWGSEKILNKSPELTEQGRSIARASRSWRLKLQNQNKRAFSEWKCLVMTEAKKSDGFTKLLKTGGATIITNDEDWESQGLTHIFLEPKFVPLPEDLSKMVAKGVHCLKPEFVIHSLTDEVDIENYYVAEAQKILSDRSKTKRQSTRQSTRQSGKTKNTKDDKTRAPQ